jgi:WD40 repeat protein
VTDDGPPADAPVNEEPDVFLSYSRRDQEFVLRLAKSLEEAGWTAWVDTDDIPPAAEWRDELTAGIRAAHTFVFALSPDSVESEYCGWELDQAVALGKRLVPLVIRDVEAAPDELASRQYIFMRADDDFDQALGELSTALGTDLDWVKQHRHWLLEALRWDAQGRDRSMLARGRDLKAAEAWLARQADRTEPRPTQLQNEFLISSRAWEKRRLQIIAGAVGVALAVSVALGVLALLQRNDARNQAAIARSRELALSSTSQLSVDPERSLLLATEAVKARPTAEADNALRRAIFASRVRAQVPVETQRIGGLINDVTFSRDGKLVAAGLKDGSVAIVSSTAREGTSPTVLPAPTPSGADVCSQSVGGSGAVEVAFSKDGRFVSAVNNQGWIQLWRWPRPSAPVTSPFCLGATTAPDPLRAAEAVLFGKNFEPGALTFASADTLALVESDGQLLRWKWKDRAKPVLLGRSEPPILAAAFSADGRVNARADAEGITIGTPAEASLDSLPVRDVYALAMSADGSTIAAANGREVMVWSRGRTPSRRVLRTGSTIRNIAVSRDGRLVAVGDFAHAVRVWDLARDGRPVVLAGSQGPVTAVEFSTDGRRIVSGGDDGVVRVWEWDVSRLPSLAAPARRATSFELTFEGRLVALDPRGSRDAWLATDGSPRPVRGIRQPTHFSVSRDGSRAVAPVDPIESNLVQLWDLDRSPLPRTIASEQRVNEAQLSGDGRWIAFAGGRLQLAPWPGKPAQALEPSGLFQYTAVAFSPESRRVAAAAYDGKSSTIFTWDVPAGTDPVHTFSTLGAISALAFSPEGDRLVAAGRDGAARIWELDGAAAQPVALRGHLGAVNAAAFNPDGTEVVSGGSDGTVRVWRLDRGGKDVILGRPGGPVAAVAFTADGTEVIATGTKGSRVWRCDFCGSTSDVLATAQRLATRTLTPDERTLFLHER